MSDAVWATFRNTQLTLLKSDFVLKGALRDPEIAALPLVQAQTDPARWLRHRLQVGFVDNSEILSLRMYGSQDEMKQLTQLVDTVAQSYLNEVVYKDRQQVLVTKESLARSLDGLQHELDLKRQELHDLAMALGSAEHGGVGQVELQLSLKRLDRIETELMRLENEQLATQLQAEPMNEPPPDMKTKLKFYEQRIAQLNARQHELETEVKSLSETSVDLETRAREVEQLQRLVDEMSTRLEAMEVETRGTPDRIRLIQPAVVSHLGTTTVPTE